MVSVPSSSSVHLRLLPSAPQSPLAISAARAVTGRSPSAMQTASRLAKNFLFINFLLINFPLSSIFSPAVPPVEAGSPAPAGIPAEANKSGAGQKNPTPHIRHKSPKPPLAKGAAILYNGDWRSKLLLCRRGILLHRGAGCLRHPASCLYLPHGPIVPYISSERKGFFHRAGKDKTGRGVHASRPVRLIYGTSRPR